MAGHGWPLPTFPSSFGQVPGIFFGEFQPSGHGPPLLATDGRPAGWPWLVGHGQPWPAHRLGPVELISLVEQSGLVKSKSFVA